MERMEYANGSPWRKSNAVGIMHHGGGGGGGVTRSAPGKNPHRHLATTHIWARRQATMPPGTPYNACILPYNIRVDEFTTLPPTATPPALHLLSHTHADHIIGLSSKSFGYQVVCSHDAKEMLLRHEVYNERALHEREIRAEKTRTFAHLKADPRVEADGRIYFTGSRDLLVRFSHLNDFPVAE
jgi:hypothetical protein